MAFILAQAIARMADPAHGKGSRSGAPHRTGAPVVRALMPAYVVPFTVCARILCVNNRSFDTTAAVKWFCIVSNASMT